MRVDRNDLQEAEFVFEMAQKPQPFDEFLDTLAELLIDAAERDGAIAASEPAAQAA